MKEQLRLWWPAAVALILALAARYAWIEPRAFGLLCNDLSTGPWWCWARQGVIKSFAYPYHALGYAALALGVLSLIFRRRALALTGVCVALAGLVLYCFEYSAVGLLLSVLTLARLAQAPVGPEHTQGQQQA